MKEDYRMIRVCAVGLIMLAGLLSAAPLLAADDLDKYPGSALYARPVEVAEDLWSSIGATQPPTYENSGHNNNLSFVIGERGVLVVNGGAAYVLAKALHDEIRQVTDKPVLYVVNENAQGHAMLGNNYWKEQGATLIAHGDAAAVWEEEAWDVLERMKGYNKDKAAGTEVVMVDETFADALRLDLGGVTAELINFGPAHSPGDISVWIPERNVIIAGDMAFHERLLPIFEETVTADWIESFAAFADFAQDAIVIPGHGGPTDMATVDRYTRGYLIYLREKIGALLDAGGTLAEAYEVDQSPYAELDTFEFLAKRNAGAVYVEMEFE
jgi:glyoxylase-like metal-dependent hydrolase (beta-lactamase superfamily II)